MPGSIAASVPETTVDFSGVAKQFQNPPADIKSRREQMKQLEQAAMKSKVSKPKSSKPIKATEVSTSADEEDESEVELKAPQSQMGHLTLEDEDGTKVRLGVLDHGQNEFCRVFILKISENFMYMPKAGTKFNISFVVDGEEVTEKLICLGSSVVMERSETMVLTLHRF